MEIPQELTNVGLGALIALIYQVVKGKEWSSWLSRAIAVGVGSVAGVVTDGGVGGAASVATATLATHAVAFGGTKLGEALSIELGPLLLGRFARAAGSKDVAEQINKPPTP